jgi:hypothetical protein
MKYSSRVIFSLAGNSRTCAQLGPAVADCAWMS